GSLLTGTTILPEDNTIPQNNEGDQYLAVTHTPEDANNILEIEWMLNMSNSSSSLKRYISALFKNSDVDALAAGMGGNTSTPHANAQSVGHHRMVAGGTSPIDFKIRAGT